MKFWLVEFPIIITPLLDKPTRRNITNQVWGELLIMEEMEEEEPPEIEEEIQGEPPAKKKKDPVGNVIGELFELHTQQHLLLHSQKVEKELDMYKTELQCI